MMENKIGYISISGFKENTYSQFKEALTALQKDGMKGLILDLRDNPGGLVRSVYEIGDELLPEGNYLAIAYRGDYTDGNARCIPLLLSYLEEARLKADGDLLELVWVDIHTTGNRAEYLPQLQLKVKNI